MTTAEEELVQLKRLLGICSRVLLNYAKEARFGHHNTVVEVALILGQQAGKAPDVEDPDAITGATILRWAGSIADGNQGTLKTLVEALPKIALLIDHVPQAIMKLEHQRSRASRSAEDPIAWEVGKDDFGDPFASGGHGVHDPCAWIHAGSLFFSRTHNIPLAVIDGLRLAEASNCCDGSYDDGVMSARCSASEGCGRSGCPAGKARTT